MKGCYFLRACLSIVLVLSMFITGCSQGAQNVAFQKTGEILKSIIGKTPALVRPPYGTVSDNVLKVAELQGYKLIIWSTDTFDWSQKDENNIVKNVIDNVRPPW